MDPECERCSEGSFIKPWSEVCFMLHFKSIPLGPTLLLGCWGDTFFNVKVWYLFQHGVIWVNSKVTCELKTQIDSIFFLSQRTMRNRNCLVHVNSYTLTLAKGEAWEWFSHAQQGLIIVRDGPLENWWGRGGGRRGELTARLAQWNKRQSAEREAVGSNPGRTSTQGL